MLGNNVMERFQYSDKKGRERSITFPETSMENSAHNVFFQNVIMLFVPVVPWCHATCSSLQFRVKLALKCYCAIALYVCSHTNLLA